VLGSLFFLFYFNLGHMMHDFCFIANTNEKNGPISIMHSIIFVHFIFPKSELWEAMGDLVVTINVVSDGNEVIQCLQYELLLLSA